MTESAVVYTCEKDSAAAGLELAGKLNAALKSAPADALVVFASPHYDHGVLLRTLEKECKPKILIGASSAGEFTSQQRGEGLACALGLRSTEFKFAAGVARQMSRDRAAAAARIVSSFRGPHEQNLLFRSALILTDALAGHADDLVDQLTVATAGKYQFFGGGAGDNAQFRRTEVFYGAEALSDAAVALEILSEKPVGIGVGHGWEPASAPMRVTHAEGMSVVSLNGFPAVDAFARHAEATGQSFDRAQPLPFFLHNIIGIDTGSGYRLRVPL